MTDSERQLIENLIQRIQNAAPPQLDREADELIRGALSARPDALYILVQSVLIQEMALNRANAQIAQLRQQSSAPAQPSFLGGSGQAPQAGSYASGYQSSRYQQDAPPPAPAPRYEYIEEPPRSRFSNFLHNAAQTAAGVVAGEVAFSALSSLFGHHESYGGGFGGGSGFLGGGFAGGGETIVNNYYEGGNERPLEHGLSPDLEDRRFADTSDAGNDDMVRDDLESDDGTDDSYDDSSSDDSFSDDDSSDV